MSDMTNPELAVFVVGAMAACVGLGCLFAGLRIEWRIRSRRHKATEYLRKLTSR